MAKVRQAASRAPLILPATLADALAVEARLRPSDRLELQRNGEATGRGTSAPAVRALVLDSFFAGEAWAMWSGDTLLGMGGVAAMGVTADAFGAIWFLGTEEADARPKELTRGARRFVEMQTPHWQALGNMLPRGFERRRSWLEAMGFDFREPEAQGIKESHVFFVKARPTGPEDGRAAR